MERSSSAPTSFAVDSATLDFLHRLERFQTEQEQKLSQQRDDVNYLKTGYDVIRRDLSQLATQMDRLVGRIEDGRKANWPLYTLILGMVPLAAALLGFFMTSYIQGSIAPIEAKIAQLTTDQSNVKTSLRDLTNELIGREKDISSLLQNSTVNAKAIGDLTDSVHRISDLALNSQSADANSRTDRVQLNDRIKTLERELAQETSERKEQAAEARVSRSEIETQFHAVSNMENLRWAWQNRVNALQWERVHPGERWPDAAFFPTSVFQGPGGSPPVGGK